MSKHVLLRVGFYNFWLPDDAGVATTLKVLSKAKLVNESGYGASARLVPATEDTYTGRAEVSMQYTTLKPATPKPEPPPRIAQERPGKSKQRLLEFKP